MNIYNYTIISILLNILFSQQTLDFRPLSINDETILNAKQIYNDQVHNEKELLKDQERPTNSPFRYGKRNKINLNFFNVANKSEINGDEVWLLSIISPEAYAISIEFDKFYINDTGRFFVYNDEKTSINGAYTHLNNSPQKFFSTPLVEGQEIILEYNGSNNGSEINISYIIHDYRDILNYYNEDRNRDCGTNPSCDSALPYLDQINATSWLDMGGAICSGSMVNNTAQDLTPYYMTAWHCIDGSSPSGYRFYFNYDTNSCNSSSSSYGSYAYGSILRASSGSMDGDFALLEITGNISESWNVFYAGWNRNSNNQSVEVGVHHPGGSPKKVNFDDDFATTGYWGVNWYGGGYSPGGSYWEITWDDGGTEGGSSGSPAYDNNGRLIGVLSGGGNSCSQSAISGESYYAKFSYAWNFGSNNSNRLSVWLDPLNLGVFTIDGTYDGLVYGCTDPNACNYDSNAINDNGSCYYPIGTCDCNGDSIENYCDCEGNILDYCGECGGDGTSCLSPVNLSFGEQSLGSFEIILSSEYEISGFQFLINDTPDELIITGASGGIAQDNDFNISTSESGVILGFSLSGGIIPPGENIITNIEYVGVGLSEICMSDAVISDFNAQEYPVNYGSCMMIEGFSHLSFGNINPGLINIEMENTQSVAGFQFLISDIPDNLDIIGTTGGISEEYGFTMSFSEEGQILGFDFNGSVIPPGNHLLTQLEVAGIDNSVICIQNGVIAGINNIDLNVSYGDCETITFSVLGDLNNDGLINVIDIVNLVNIILFPEDQNVNIILSGDMNDDGQLNVIDIVNLVGLILED